MSRRSAGEKKLRESGVDYKPRIRQAKSPTPTNSKRVLIADEDATLLRNLA